MIRRLATTAAAACIFLAATAQADELQCIAARHAAAAKFLACESKAITNPKSDVLFPKCREKYAARWAMLQQDFPGTSCDAPRFVDNGTTITDNLTQLVWEKKDSSDGVANLANIHDVDNRYTWSVSSPDANGTLFTDFLDSMNSGCFAGQCDWRVPTLFELHTILQPGCPTDPCVIDPMFLPALSGIVAHWTSVTTQINNDLAWATVFYGGNSGSGAKVSSGAVRGVRGGM